jgi:SAM-dependent methyltransferase
VGGASGPARATLKARAESFGVAAAAYERGRPSYPEAAIEWLLPPGAARVLDLGAGTGKLTRQLRDRGLDVVAVEPSRGMREQLAAELPGVKLLAGTAEAIPLGNHTVDAVLVAQAWHWVDPALAVPEVTRVLTPGGSLGLIWNIRDEREQWVAQLGRIMHAHGDEDTGAPSPVVGPPFGLVRLHQVEWTYRLSGEALLDLVASRSYVITLAERERAAILDEVRALLATHPALAGGDMVGLPYITACFRAELI